jgi:predicted HicB family RNase H-like nuclease
MPAKTQPRKRAKRLASNTPNDPSSEARQNATIRIKPSLKRKAQLVAVAEGVTLSDLIEAALQAHLTASAH